MATAQINRLTLAFENVKLPEKTIRWQHEVDMFAKKLLILMLGAIAVISIGCAIPYGGATPVGQPLATIYTAVEHGGSVLILSVSFFLLPRLGIKFVGMNNIACCIMTVLQFEFNSVLYDDYANIANL
ncbi:MAG: hypothetical protein P4M11_10080 [Candidatus Pacebacteria bacterium]|nr:hypothetical protein [Candidatus Paceibacterota bacterium]